METSLMYCHNGDKFVKQEQQHAEQVDSKHQQRNTDHARCLDPGSPVLFVDIPDRLNEITETIQYSIHDRLLS
jgi:hypothetical protein